MATNIFYFSNYYTIVLYTHDYTAGKLMIAPLEAYGFAPNEHIKVKVLEHAGLDITRAGGSFITDVHLTDDMRRFCDAIVPRHDAPQLRVDYSLEKYWALTSRLRGYRLTFQYARQIAHRPLKLRPINRSRLETLLVGCGAWYKDGDDDVLENASEESAFDVNRDLMAYGVPQQAQAMDQSSATDSYVEELDSDDSSARANSDDPEPWRQPGYGDYFKDPTVKIINEMEYDNGTLLVVEYNEGCDAIAREEIKQVANSAVVDFFDSDDAKSCTVMTANNIHTNAWDMVLRPDFGAFHSGFNCYGVGNTFHGLVLMGQQEGGDNFNYANALKQGIIIPDFYL